MELKENTVAEGKEAGNTESETLADLSVTESNTEFVRGGVLLREGSHGTHVAGTIGAVGNNGVGLPG